MGLKICQVSRTRKIGKEKDKWKRLRYWRWHVLQQEVRDHNYASTSLPKIHSCPSFRQSKRVESIFIAVSYVPSVNVLIQPVENNIMLSRGEYKSSHSSYVGKFVRSIDWSTGHKTRKCWTNTTLWVTKLLSGQLHSRSSEDWMILLGCPHIFTSVLMIMPNAIAPNKHLNEKRA